MLIYWLISANFQLFARIKLDCVMFRILPVQSQNPDCVGSRILPVHTKSIRSEISVALLFARLLYIIIIIIIACYVYS